jgi:hypothetical protein
MTTALDFRSAFERATAAVQALIDLQRDLVNESELGLPDRGLAGEVEELRLLADRYIREANSA